MSRGMKRRILTPAGVLAGVILAQACVFPGGVLADAGGDANAGDVWVDTAGAPPGPGHEMDPHLPCQSINLWGKLDGCITFNTTPLPDSDPKDGTHSTVGKWTGCTNGVELELVSVIGGGHTWPSGWQYLGVWIVGKTAKDFDASERIWSFFATKKK